MQEFIPPDFVIQDKITHEENPKEQPTHSTSKKTTIVSTKLLEQLIIENKETKEELKILKKLVLEIHNKIFGEEQGLGPATEHAGPSSTLVEEEEVENREEVEKEEQRKEKESTQTIDVSIKIKLDKRINKYISIYKTYILPDVN
ncbi:hypothetical protein TorRG33x02_186350 [Trema orientale]|uniref:Uncharacterized protein n=1 Tax=Trema orientale TaxID=63057 RepID=A0A2P5EJG1_TREOI|nr:hypothetical protein TorRG33x02_186350 [Trema orientale]